MATDWPDTCEYPGCSNDATHLFGLASPSRPSAEVVCSEHVAKRVEELKAWASQHGNNFSPVIMPRCEGAESFLRDVRIMEESK